MLFQLGSVFYHVCCHSADRRKQNVEKSRMGSRLRTVFYYFMAYYGTAECRQKRQKQPVIETEVSSKLKCTQLVIRHAAVTDGVKLAEIEQMSYPQAEGASQNRIEERIEAFPDHFWIMEKSGEIVAFINGMATDAKDLSDEMYVNASIHDENGRWQMIFSVVTAPEHRGHGYASRIMRQVITDAKKDSRQGAVLTCKKELIDFYSKFGFVNEGVSVSIHGGALWYQMRLTF